MYQPTTITWTLIIFGLLTCLPLLFAQFVMLKEPEGKAAKDLLIGKNKEWRDKTHFKSQYGLAISDCFIFFPLFIIGIIGMLLGSYWGYLLFAVSGAIQLYKCCFMVLRKTICLPYNRPSKILYIFLGKLYLLGGC